MLEACEDDICRSFLYDFHLSGHPRALGPSTTPARTAASKRRAKGLGERGRWRVEEGLGLQCGGWEEWKHFPKIERSFSTVCSGEVKGQCREEEPSEKFLALIRHTRIRMSSTLEIWGCNTPLVIAPLHSTSL